MLKDIKKQKIEAIKRMNLLNLNKNIIEEFKNEGTIYKSKEIGSLSLLNEEESKIVEKFKNETEYLPYHVILSNRFGGKTISIFFISNFTDEWYLEKEYIKQNRVVAYVENLDNEIFSEFGFVFIRKGMGGLIRVG